MGSLLLPTVPTNLPLDWIIIGALVVIVAAITLRTGAGLACTVALALPAADILTALVPHAALLSGITGGLAAPLPQAILFLVLTGLMYLIVARIGLSYGSERGAPIQAVIAGVATTAIVVSFWLQIPGLDSVWHFGAHIQAIFAEQYRLWWLTLGYIVLAIVRS
jgi:hypothetical protein